MFMRLVRVFWSMFGDDILQALGELMAKWANG